ncbi:hypothetical protein ACUVJH_16550 [Aeromonas veronii]|uniref:hypothetical protein n=1 Tax=Aeromonas veronii TaxID=654 RepID=UPI0040556260
MIKNTDKLNSILDEFKSGEYIDHEAPMTSLDNLIKKIKNELELDDELIKMASNNLTKILSSPEYMVELLIENIERTINEIKVRYQNDTAFSSLLNLLENVDSAQPEQAVKIIDNSGILGSEKSILESSCLAYQLKGIKGEKLAKKLITITPTLIEDCYKRYLHFLVSCKYALENSQKIASDKLGVMLTQVASLQSDYPLLIHPNIAWIRNSVAHKNWTYDAKTNMVKLKDNKGVEHLFSPEHLVAEVLQPFNISSLLFMDAAYFYKCKKVLEVMRSNKNKFSHAPNE